MKKYLSILLLFFAPIFFGISSVKAFTVNSGDDTTRISDNKCTLREALILVNRSINSDTDCGTDFTVIDIEVPLVTITISGLPTNDISNGDLDIILNPESNFRSLTINGALEKKTIITTETRNRIFHIQGFSNIIFSNLEITGGEDNKGGGIYNEEGNIIIDTSLIHSNNAFDGGGVYNYTGDLKINYSVIRDNYSENQGGGIYNIGNTYIDTSLIILNESGSNGGGIANSPGIFGYYPPYLELKGSSVSHNTAGLLYERVGGGGISSINGLIKVQSSEISSNEVLNGAGGGILNGEGDIFILDGSTISNNIADIGGGISNNNGKVEIYENKLYGNIARENGGLFYNYGSSSLYDSTIHIERSEIFNNKAEKGGVGYNRGQATPGTGKTISNIERSYIHKNYASDNGSVGYNTYTGQFNFYNTEIYLNGLEDSYRPETSAKTKEGGVVWTGTNSTTNFINTTISENYAQSASVAYNEDKGTTSFRYSTIADNYYNTPIFKNTAATTRKAEGYINLFASIVAFNGNITCDTATIINAAHSFIYKTGGGNDLSCKLSGFNNFTDIDPKFDGGLRNNGGTTRTYALYSDSKAIDHAASDSSCSTTTRGVDQRMYPKGRPGQPCDAGAFEYLF